MFSAGTPDWMTWIGAKMNPPPGARSSMRLRTSARTSAGVPNGSTRCVSQLPPQIVRSRPYSRLNFAVSSMPAQLTCQGFMMSTPASISSGRVG